jgi:surface antigen
MSTAEKKAYAQNNLQVGDIIIWKSNGSSHTGIVKSINSDGSFTTIEGNSSDQVKSNTKKITDSSLTGFISLSKVYA